MRRPRFPRRAAAALALAGALAAAGPATADVSRDVRIDGRYGHVEFKAHGERLIAVDSFGDRRGVRAHLRWRGGNSASAHDRRFDPNPAERNLSIPEGTRVTLTMCYTKRGLDVRCSDFKVGVA